MVTKSSQKNAFFIHFYLPIPAFAIHFQEPSGSLNSIKNKCFVGKIITIENSNKLL